MPAAKATTSYASGKEELIARKEVDKIKTPDFFDVILLRRKEYYLLSLLNHCVPNGMHGSVREGISQVRKIPPTRLGSMQNLKSF